MSCGSWHAAAVTESGQIFIWGYKKACGDALMPGPVKVEQIGGSLLGTPTNVAFSIGVKIAGVSKYDWL